MKKKIFVLKYFFIEKIGTTIIRKIFIALLFIYETKELKKGKLTEKKKKNKFKFN